MHDIIYMVTVMNYLLYGLETFLLEKEIDKIIAKHKLERLNIVRYDYTVDSLIKILEDCETLPFFSDKKGIIVDNATFFNRGKGSDMEINQLLNYLKRDNPTTILIFLNHNMSVDNTKKITKTIKELGVLKEVGRANIQNEILKMFDGYKIDHFTINLFHERVGSDLALLQTEANKLKLYCIEEKTISKEDVIQLTSINIDTDIFKFIDHIIQKEKDLAMKIYREMIKQGEEPIKIIALLASKFRLMYQATELMRSGYSQQDISSTLGVHIYPVKLAIQSGLKYNNTLLLKYLERLADLDIAIKTGEIEPILGLELFILNI